MTAAQNGCSLLHMRKAFTLIEVVCVLVLMAIVSTATVSVLPDDRGDDMFIAKLRARINLARTEAMRVGLPVVVSCNAASCVAEGPSGPVSVSGTTGIPVPDDCSAAADGFVACFGPDGVPHPDNACSGAMVPSSLPAVTCGKTLTVTDITGFPEVTP